MDIKAPSMREKPVQSGLETVTRLLRDPVIIRIVTVLDTVSLSILELLEYNLSRRDISYALSNGVIEIDKTSLPKDELAPGSIGTFLVSGDVFYYRYLSSKVRLTELGRHILSSIKDSLTDQEVLDKAREMFESDTFMPPDRPSGPI